MNENDETQLERRTLKSVTSKFTVYFFLAMAMMCALLTIVGVAGLLSTGVEILDSIPENVILLAVGMIGFSLFFPWFTAIYFSRHLLRSVERIERRIADLTGESE